MKNVITAIRNLGYTESQVSEQDIKRAYWRNAKQRNGIGADPAYVVHQYLKINQMIKEP